MATYASVTAENNSLTGLITSCAYFGANTGSPSTTGANEVTYASGNRAAITWGSASSGSIANITTALTLNIPSSTTCSYFSLWGASSGTGSGGYQIGGPLSPTVTFTSAGTLTVAVGGLSLTSTG